MFNEKFTALANEAAFAYEILHSGVMQIRNANYARKGLYFQSFINLSVGLERIAKICLILDYYIENDGAFPDEKYLKNNIGHNILRLYEKSILIKNKYAFEFKFLNSLDSPIYQNILKIISDFAIKDRYENLNILVNAKQENNPISLWFHNVDIELFEKHVSKNKKIKIEHNAHMMETLVAPFMLVMHSSEDGKDIINVEEASLRTGLYEAVCPYRQLYVAHVIRFWTELIWELQYKAMASRKEEDIPFFSDMFGCFYNDDSYLRTRKNYETC